MLRNPLLRKAEKRCSKGKEGPLNTQDSIQPFKNRRLFDVMMYKQD